MYEAGDKFQQESVDAMFDVSKPSNWSPEKMMNMAADLADRSAEALRDMAHDESEDEKSEEGTSDEKSEEGSSEAGKSQKAGKEDA
jgi:hypothetical protein